MKLPANLSLPQGLCIALYLVLTTLLCIGAPWPQDLALHHSMTIVGLLALLWANTRQRWSMPALLMMLGFLTLHSLGARWSYSYVPYDHWTQSLLDWKLSTVMHWQRNHWDRLVHLCYGLLLTFPLYERLRRHFGVGTSRWLALELIASSSMVYELIEWGAAVLLAPARAEAYNGQQGDMFDAQKDMALALSGALLTALLLALRNKKRPSPAAQTAAG